MTYQELKEQDYELYTLACHYRTKHSGGTNDNIRLDRSPDEGGFSFGRTHEGSDFWITVYRDGVQKSSKIYNRAYLLAKTRGLTILVTQDNDKEMWEYIIKKANELKEEF